MSESGTVEGGYDVLLTLSASMFPLSYASITEWDGLVFRPRFRQQRADSSESAQGIGGCYWCESLAEELDVRALPDWNNILPLQDLIPTLIKFARAL